MRHARPDYDAIQPWPIHRPHLVRDTSDGRIIAVVGAPHDREVDKAVEEGRLAPLIPEDEPVFLVRAQDMVGADTVRAWAEFAEGVGADPDMVAAARNHAEAMDRWREEHGGGKVPDRPDRLPLYPERSRTDSPGRLT